MNLDKNPNHEAHQKAMNFHTKMNNDFDKTPDYMLRVDLKNKNNRKCFELQCKGTVTTIENCRFGFTYLGQHFIFNEDFDINDIEEYSFILNHRDSIFSSRMKFIEEDNSMFWNCFAKDNLFHFWFDASSDEDMSISVYTSNGHLLSYLAVTIFENVPMTSAYNAAHFHDMMSAAMARATKN